METSKDETDKGCYQQMHRIGSATLLTIQNASTILLLRYIRTLPGDRFLNTSAVFFAEIFKSMFSFLFLIAENKSIVDAITALSTNFNKHKKEILKTCIPALLYSIQNNLLYISISNLDAATFQITYQIKILTTAVCIVILMKRKLFITQWISLIILFCGVAIIQVEGLQNKPKKDIQPVIGLLSVVSACILSGVAGVYLEKILKKSKISIWIKNIELGIFSTIFCAVTMFVKDGNIIKNSGILFGYSSLVWFSIILQSLGGMIVAVVIKKFDNIIKGFATSASLILACVVSVTFLDSVLTATMVTGAILVLMAILLYVYAPNLKLRNNT